jgi:hypothetical protein
MLCGDNGGVRISSGEPCKMRVVKGTTRCFLHGGVAPQSKIKAEMALALVRVPAVQVLHAIIEQYMDTQCATCGYPTGDNDAQRTVIQAAKATLDRTGMGPSSKVELTTQSDGALNLELLTPDERAEMLALGMRIQEIKDRVRARQYGLADELTTVARPHEVH